MASSSCLGSKPCSLLWIEHPQPSLCLVTWIACLTGMSHGIFLISWFLISLTNAAPLIVNVANRVIRVVISHSILLFLWWKEGKDFKGLLPIMYAKLSTPTGWREENWVLEGVCLDFVRELEVFGEIKLGSGERCSKYWWAKPLAAQHLSSLSYNLLYNFLWFFLIKFFSLFFYWLFFFFNLFLIICWSPDFSLCPSPTYQVQIELNSLVISS